MNTCSAPWLCHYLTNYAGIITVDNFGANCNSNKDLIDDCGCGSPVTAMFDVELYSQADVDAFAVQYQSCPFPIHNMNIGYEQGSTFSGIFNGPQPDPILSLTALLSIDSVYGYLRIATNKSLESLSGLLNLSFVGGDLWINYNLLLQDLDGLEALATVGGDLQMIGNGNLNDIEGFQNVSHIGHSLRIQDNRSLMHLEGFNNLSHIGQNLQLFNNRKLKGMLGLHSLQTIGGSFDISGNRKLTSFDGLESLSQVGEDVDITGSIALVNISALSNLSSIDGILNIINNPKLDICNLGWVCDHIAQGKPYEIYGNATGCFTGAGVSLQCNCPFDLTLPMADGLYRARNEIKTLNGQQMMNYGVYDAPNVLLDKGFEVPKGTSLWILSNGCDE